ncbi:exopolysaccharide biosynthesis protein [Devosia sp. YIM 151766]|uniref:exopolysaccharide biosynthesis protein n=1 Tax=Devosia sp. YIM 151766 TaxID=3017325 RepID=UPI00255C7BCF|nr:exopolysaccharide biosynthesis protein [Devosia sp. YIM 151766]WIY54247.1 exopolysaccharide biosynthesis protein [Devosia sp. YIM 151766]
MTARYRPINHYTNRIVAGLRRVAESDAPQLTFARLIETMGDHSHRLLILMLTLLNMIPGPPGFGGTIAWTTFAVALFMVLGRPIRLPGIIGRRKLPLALLLKASEQVAKVTAIIARFSRPRWRWLTGAAATIPYGIFTMAVSVFMTLPIPFINAVPNVGLCILAFAMLNRDGLGAIIGLAICAIGLIIAGLLLFGVVNLGMAAMAAVG